MTCKSELSKLSPYCATSICCFLRQHRFIDRAKCNSGGLAIFCSNLNIYSSREKSFPAINTGRQKPDLVSPVGAEGIVKLFNIRVLSV